MEEENSRSSSPFEEDDDVMKSPELKTKKGSKPTKKSMAKAAEIEKRENYLKYLLGLENLPEYVKEVLQEEIKVRGYVFTLNLEGMEMVWTELGDIVSGQMEPLMGGESGDKDEAVQVLLAVLNLLEYLHTEHDPKECEPFQGTVHKLNSYMMQADCPSQLKDEICALSEFCCLRGFHLAGDFFLKTFLVLFDLTLNENTPINDLKQYVKRMWEMRRALGRINLKAQSCEIIIEKLMKAVTCPAYLSCKEGKHFIAFTFTLDSKLIKKFYQEIKTYLPHCKRPQAIAYGEAFYHAWSFGSPEIKQVLETQVIQNLMTHMFVFPRKKQELSGTGQNVFAILSYLHKQRTLSSFSKTLTELYQPLLWRHLRSGNNIERCNAAEVFLDVYPLERPGSGRAEESTFLEKQQGEMVDLITDTNHLVRIIALRGICRKLSSAWTTFSQESLTIIFRNLVSMAYDTLATVRKTLFDSLPILFSNPESAAYLSRILPSLGIFLHDENEKVRRSFVKLLYLLKSMPSPPIRYLKIASLEHIAARLKLDGPEVCTDISKLIMSEMYKVEFDVHKAMFRICKFIDLNAIAARKFFAYSSKSLGYEDALRLMKLILINLRAYIKSKEDNPDQEQENEYQEDQAPVCKKKKPNSREALKTINENEQEGQSDEEDEEEGSSAEPKTQQSQTKDQVPVEDNPYEWPEVSHGLVDIVSLLWTVHCTKLTSSEYESDLEDLTLVACRVIPLLLKYYKGQPTYFAVVHLASLIPAAKLVPVSTVCSACVSHLKQLNELTPDEETDVIVHALCAWNRFVDMQDIVIDWLDQAFRSENLNQSKAPRGGEDCARPRRVRFEAADAKPMLALKILNTIFSHPLNSSRVREKSYNQVYDLFIYMERIKVAIERRLIGGLPLDSPLLSDEFLIACLYRYTKLILFLHRPEPVTAKEDETIVEPFDAALVFEDFVLWTMRVISPMLPQQFGDEKDLSVRMLNVVVRASVNLTNLMFCSNDTLLKISKLVRTLLSSECSLWFVESGLQVMKQIKEFSESESFIRDSGELMTAVVPALLSRVLQSFSANKYNKEQVLDTINNLHEVKNMLYEVLMGIQIVSYKKPELMQTILVLFTDSIVAIIVHDIRQLQLLDLVNKVQDLPFLCQVMLSIVTKPTLVSLWLKTLPHSISNTYSQDSNVLGAAVSLLHTLVHCELKLPKEELKTAVQEAYTIVTQYSRDSTQPDTETSSVSNFSVEYIDIKKTAIPVLKDLAEVLELELC